LTIEAPTGSAGVAPAAVPPSLAATWNDLSRNGTGTTGDDQRNPKNCRLEAGVTCRRDGRAPSIFGCDECILACPHELGKPPRRNTDFQHHPEWQNLTHDQILNMTEDEFQKTFANSGFIRLGLNRLKQNLP
jgi:epoxyqueuosine reductase QueG